MCIMTITTTFKSSTIIVLKNLDTNEFVKFRQLNYSLKLNKKDFSGFFKRPYFYRYFRNH